eukprot:2982561-Rhodomonas_salina.1
MGFCRQEARFQYTKQRYSMVPGLGVQQTCNQYRVVPFVMLNLALLGPAGPLCGTKGKFERSRFLADATVRGRPIPADA